MYRNGEKINSDVVTDLEFTDTELQTNASTTNYVVTAVYDRGESMPSPVYSYDMTGVNTINADDAPVEYFNIQGMRIPADRLEPGVYVRLQGSKATKVIVK